MNHTQAEATDNIRYAFFVGAALTVVGAALLVGTWPEPHHGTSLLWFAALAVTVAGSSLLLIGAIGWGVSLGIRGSGRFADPVAPAAPASTVPPVRRRRSAADVAPLDPPH